MNPDSLSGLIVRVDELERKAADGRNTHNAIYDRLNQADRERAVLKKTADDLERRDLEKDKEIDALQVELATMRAKVGLYGALGAIIGSGFMTLLVQILVR